MEARYYLAVFESQLFTLGRPDVINDSTNKLISIIAGLGNLRNALSSFLNFLISRDIVAIPFYFFITFVHCYHWSLTIPGQLFPIERNRDREIEGETFKLYPVPWRPGLNLHCTYSRCLLR